MATTAQPITDTLEDIGIVDCDAHFTEPPYLWTSRAPASDRPGAGPEDGRWPSRLVPGR